MQFIAYLCEMMLAFSADEMLSDVATDEEKVEAQWVNGQATELMNHLGMRGTPVNVSAELSKCLH